MKSSHAKSGFGRKVLAELHTGKILRITSGDGSHRYIGIWVVVVQDRAFVRSWSLDAHGWQATLVAEHRGSILIKNRPIAVRARLVRSERLRSEVDRAYLEKYSTPGSLKYARDLGRAKSRSTTTELLPAAGTRAWCLRRSARA
jgi:hypothetical protein